MLPSPFPGFPFSLSRRGIQREIPEATFSGWRHLYCSFHNSQSQWMRWGEGKEEWGRMGWEVGRKGVGWGLGVSSLAVETVCPVLCRPQTYPWLSCVACFLSFQYVTESRLYLLLKCQRLRSLPFLLCAEKWKLSSQRSFFSFFFYFLSYSVLSVAC